ncbi:AraC-like DNA-binding protein [Streptomyces sp. V4I8]|uniref:helix-turn-helix domain-containing protein n=1 Tax=Streptomyces sp. V4I8 TaxID=3156469 RepID=UPI0035193AEB
MADPDLSPSTLARQLGVSVRTLHRRSPPPRRPWPGYVRRHRLERARADPLADRGSVSDLAAHWQFADSSHFVRAFKRAYGWTPTAYARECAPR